MNYQQKIIIKRTRIENRITNKYKIFPWNIDITTDNETKSGIRDFKILFNSNDPYAKTFLWNSFLYIDTDRINKDDFTDEEYQFILDREESLKSRSLKLINANNAILTNRLILKPGDDSKMLKKYRQHLKEDGDFLLYAGLKLTRVNLDCFSLTGNYCFGVFEKETGNMVGMVGLYNYDEERRTAKMQWYIFKPFRKLGYGKEAVTALAKYAFDRKLFEWREKLMKNTFIKHFANIDLICVDIRVSNTASQKLALACGFKEQYIDRRHFVVEGKGVEDGVIMELEPENTRL